MIDVNVYLSRWPFRRLPGDEAADLAARLRQRNVTQAWTGTFDGIFHKGLSSANARLANDCRRHAASLLNPFGSVSPKLADWQEDLRRCERGVPDRTRHRQSVVWWPLPTGCREILSPQLLDQKIFRYGGEGGIRTPGRAFGPTTV
jgi:hypothetical protein